MRSNLCWNRAGTELIFAKDNLGDENHDLFALNIETGAIRTLFTDPTTQEYPVEFSPDDQWLTVLTNRSGQLNLWKISADGSNYSKLTDYPNPVPNG